MTSMPLPFGLDALDRPLGGGLPGGKLSALVSPPESQSDLLLEQLAGTHEALYVSTNRPAQEVREQLDAIGDGATTEVASVRPTDLLVDWRAHLEDVPSGGVVIVDRVNGLEVGDRDAYLDFLEELRGAAAANDAAVLLHCPGTESPPHLRSVTLGRADLAMELRMLFHPRKIETYLTVTKHRGGAARPEPIKLVLTDRIRVDTSRDIA